MGDGIGIVMEGVGDFNAALRAVEVRAEIAGKVATNRGAHLVQAKTQAKLSAQSNTAGMPSPAAPGEPPATITGTLKRSVRVESAVRLGFGAYQAKVGPTVVYARIQELGGVITGSPLKFAFDGGFVQTDQVTIPARPYLGPSLKESRGELAAVYRDAWKYGTRP